MLDELKEDSIANKVGGKFKLSTLIQKRMIALNQGARPLVDLRTNNKMEIVIQEILQDKIYLDLSERVMTVTEDPEPMHHETIDLTSAANPPAAPVAPAAEPGEVVETVAVETPTQSDPAPARKEKSAGRAKAAAETETAAETEPAAETAEPAAETAEPVDAEANATAPDEPATEPSA